jgi:hypothetical protein
LESFIRNKYEKKLYIKKDGEPPSNPQSKVDRLKNDHKEEKAEKEKKVHPLLLEIFLEIHVSLYKFSTYNYPFTFIS